MADLLLVLEARVAGLRMAVCTAQDLARTASDRHGLAAGSAGALAQALTGSLLLAGTERTGQKATRVDVQLECGGPLRGLLVDAEASGAVRGLVRVNELDLRGARALVRGLDRPFPTDGPLERFDARPILSTGLDERAGRISILRAQPGDESPHRAAFPFAGADLGAALTLFLRNERELGGEIALEVLHQPGEPLAAVAGVLFWPDSEHEADEVRALGKPLREGLLSRAMIRAADSGAPGNGHALAQELATLLELGPLRLLTEVRPRFACRCSRERVVRALATLGIAELKDMAGRDGGASATCDFCAAVYQISATELLELAGDEPARA